MIEINWQPTTKELRIFSWSQTGIAGAAAAWSWWQEGGIGGWAIALWGLAGLGVIGLLSARLARIMFIGWSLAAFPLGWVMSHLILASIFFCLLTPLAWVLRVFGHDRLQRRIDRDVSSYWLPRPKERPARDYFRQY